MAVTFNVTSDNDGARKVPGSGGDQDVFLEDDEEILGILCHAVGSSSSSSYKEQLPSFLEGVAERFLRDHLPSSSTAYGGCNGEDSASFVGSVSNSNTDDLWRSWSEKMQQYVGIRASTTSTMSEPPALALSALPVTFDSDDGKLHLKATTAILGISRFEAGQLTLSYMRTVPAAAREKKTEVSRFANLLGSLALLEKVMDHYFRQRIARLAVIAECLRAEQDSEDELQPDLMRVLDSVDDCYQEGGAKRGLFRILLSSACQTHVPLSFQQLEPAKYLRSSKNSKESSDASWRQFSSNATERKRSFTETERLQAMEALLALLYSRIQGGIGRSDLAMILVAFESSNSFFTGYGQGSERLIRLAALSCVECMGLWHIQHEQSTNEELWVQSHPLFRGVVEDSKGSEIEIKGILSVMKSLSKQVLERRLRAGQQSNVQVETPEGLALLSFGLLLKVAYSSILDSCHGANAGAFWQIFNNEGLELFNLANNDCNAFDYLHVVTSTLVERPPQMFRSRLSDTPYDVKYTEKFDIEESETSAVLELSSSCLLYANISRELLSSVIAAFESTILSLNHSEATKNIGVVCDLASKIFRNSLMLCESVWDALADYDNSAPSLHPFPRLLDVSYTLARNSIESLNKTPKEEIVQGVAPFLRLVSALVYNAQSVESSLKTVVPNGLVPSVLKIISQSTHVSSDAAISVLESLSTLTQVGDSASCRSAFRKQLEGSRLVADFDIAHVLVSISKIDKSRDYALHAFSMLSTLLQDSSEQMVVNVATELGSETFWRRMLSEDSEYSKSAVALIKTIASRAGSVCGCGKIPEDKAVTLLAFLEEAARACCTMLSFAIATTSSKLNQKNPSSYRTTHCLLACLKRILDAVLPLSKISADGMVKLAASNVRDSIVSNHLARNTGVSDAILYFATSPVSMVLANSLHNLVEDSDVLKVMSIGSESNSFFGNFELSNSMGTWTDSQTTDWQHHLNNLIRTLNSLAMDEFEAIQAKGWFSEDTVVLFETSLAAIGLLNTWACAVDDMMVTSDGDLVLSPLRCLSRVVIIPPPCRFSNTLSSAWLASGISYSSLLVGFLSAGDISSLNTAIQVAVLDLFRTCLVHMSLSSPVSSNESMLLADLYHSEAVHGMIEEQLDALLCLAKVGRINRQDRLPCSVALRYLRLVELCVGLSPEVGLKLLGRDPTKSFRALSEVIIETTKNPPSEKGKGSLMIPAAFLSLVVAFWKHVRLGSAVYFDEAQEKIESIVKSHGDLMSALAGFVINTAPNTTPNFKRSSSAILNYCSTQLFFKLSLDLLSLEMMWSQENNDDDSAEIEIVRAIDGAIDGEFARLIDAMYFFTSVRATESFFNAYSRISENIGFFPCSCRDIVFFFSSSTKLQRDSFTAICGPDSIATDLSFLYSKAGSESPRQAEIRNLVLSSNALDGELNRLSSWRNFCALYLFSNEKLRQSTSMPNNKVVMCTLVATAQSFLHNLTIVEEARSQGILLSEGFVLSSQLSGILLCFASKCDSESEIEQGDWIEVVRLLSDCATKLASVLAIQSLHCHGPLQQLLVASSMVFKARPSTEATETKYELVQLDFVAATCKVIAAVEQVLRSVTNQNHREKYLLCFRLCIDILSSLLTSLVFISDVEVNSIAHKIRLILNEHCIVSSIVTQVIETVRYQGGFDTGHVTSSYQLMVSALGFFNTVASVGDFGLVALFVENDISRLLSRCIFLVEQLEKISALENEVLPYRGYIRTGDKRQESFFNTRIVAKTPMFGANDPAQHIWVLSLRLLSTALPIVSVEGDIGQKTQTIATEYMKANSGRIISCLQQCWSSSKDPKSFVLTKNGLAEATQILALTSALCSTGCDVFKRECIDFYKHLEFHAKQIIGSLGSYLGASAASRYLFRAMESADVTNDVDISTSQLPAPLLYQSHSGMNAKHEAIRYSHFASGASVAISQAEKDAASQVSGRWKRPDSQKDSDPHSLPTLEWNCRSAVTSDFTFELEKQAVQCLFSAINLVWKNHPRSSAFVLFSRAETLNLDLMSMAKRGAVIAYRPKTYSTSSSLWQYPSSNVRTVSGGGPLCFGEVLHCDTLNRKWRIRSLSKSKSEVDVHESELAGIEDISKRSCVLKYSSASDSSSDIIPNVATPSIGHLILILRWCIEFQQESIGNKVDSVVVRLAELTAALLGTEISVHGLIGSQNVPSKPDDSETLSLQILDLFGELSDLGENETRNDFAASIGRLKNILGADSWEAVRSQLHDVILLACKNIETTTGDRQRLIEAESWLTVQRNGTQSPFRRGRIISVSR